MQSPPLAPDFTDGPLSALLAYAEADRAPPVEQWHPAHCGSIDIRIMADGRWFHEGGEIKRPAMVRLFSRILRREADGGFVLVTPAEQLAITVDDAPFIAVELRTDGEGDAQTLSFRMNTGDIVVAGADHPLTLRDGPAGRLPYLRVRGGADRALEARLARPVYYALAEMALDDASGGAPCVRSGGMDFAIGDAV